MRVYLVLSALLASAFGQLSFDVGNGSIIMFDAGLNTGTGQVEYTVVVPKNMYFAIGYGWNMDQTNMVIWQSTGSTSTNAQGDYWSRGENNPRPLATGNMYTTSSTVDANGVSTFITTRPVQADPAT